MANMTKEQRERAKKIKAQLRAQAGLDRDEYYANGGEMVRWRGLHQVIPDKKKRENKKRARKKVRVW